MNVVESRRLSVPSVGQSIPCRCKLGICATNCFVEFQEVLRGNEAHNIRSWGVHDQDADTRPWITDTCAASMALKASSSIFIKCHILPETHVAHNVDCSRSSETKKPKETGYKKNLVSWCKLFSTQQPKTSTRQTKNYTNQKS